MTDCMPANDGGAPAAATGKSGFEGKSIIVTGAGKGLGRGYALYLAKLGALVVVNNRRHEGEDSSSADRVVKEIQAAGGTAVANYSDVEDPAAGSGMLDQALAAFNRLDGVVANAGVAEARSFHKQELDEIRRVLDINLLGTINLLHPTFRHMYQQKAGSIIVSSSAAGLYGEHGMPAYSAAKAGLIGLMNSLSQEGRPKNVRVNALAPYAATQMTREGLPTSQHEKVAPGKLAPVVAWLLSDRCSHSGEIVISGALRMSRAQMVETPTATLSQSAMDDPAVCEATWQQLLQTNHDQTFKGAIDHFQKFMA